MKTATVVLSDDAGELWRGSLLQLFRDNDMRLRSARGIIRQLRRYGNAIVGGGAAGQFRITRATPASFNETLVRQWEAGLVSEADLRASAPDGCRVEIQPAVVLLWSFPGKHYVQRVRRERAS